jgi:hypothetical protein
MFVLPRHPSPPHPRPHPERALAAAASRAKTTAAKESKAKQSEASKRAPHHRRHHCSHWLGSRTPLGGREGKERKGVDPPEFESEFLLRFYNGVYIWGFLWLAGKQ